jgi:polyhydroxyalkanoate synthesis regulator phasin
MTETARQGGKLNVFISYSRDDLAFADLLDATLGLAGFDTSIDRRGIFGGEDWSQALDPVLKRIDVATDDDALSALAGALQAIAGRLTKAQTSQAFDPVLKKIEGADDFLDLEALAQALQALKGELTDPQAIQAFDQLLRRVDETNKVLDEAARALRSLTQTPDPQALHYDETTEISPALRRLAQALQAVAGKLTKAQANKAVTPLLRKVSETTNSNQLSVLAEALQALAGNLTEAQARQSSGVALSSLAWARSDKEAAEWSRSLVILSNSASDRDRTLAAAIAYPAAGGSATDILLDAMRATRQDAPAKDKGTQAALEWLAKTFPEVLRPPVCPEPLQPGPKCPSSASK